MKKLLALGLTVVMVLSISLTAFATSGGFVQSPSLNDDIDLVAFSIDDEDCGADLTLTSYKDRDTLEDDAKKALEDAYKDISENNDLSKLNKDLADVAEDIAVSELFDLSIASCDNHTEHGKSDIKIESERLDNFVALMALDGDSWVLIADAKIDADGYLTFTTDKFGPYAVVAGTSTSGSNGGPVTGDAFPWIYVVLMVVSVAGLVTVGLCLRKKKV